MKKLNNKGFSLIELLGSLALLGLILCLGLYSARGTLSTSLTTLDNVSDNEIKNAAELYVLENSKAWIHDEEEYACVNISILVDEGYLKNSEISSYKGMMVKIIRDSKTKVITNRIIVDDCE